jgi:hypothetical protein
VNEPTGLHKVAHSISLKKMKDTTRSFAELEATRTEVSDSCFELRGSTRSGNVQTSDSHIFKNPGNRYGIYAKAENSVWFSNLRDVLDDLKIDKAGNSQAARKTRIKYQYFSKIKSSPSPPPPPLRLYKLNVM